MKNRIIPSILVGVIWATGSATAQEQVAAGRGDDVLSWRNGGSGAYASGRAADQRRSNSAGK